MTQLPDTRKAIKLAESFYRHRQRKIEKHEANPRYTPPDERWADLSPTITELAREIDRLRYVLSGVRGAIQTGRNEPLAI